MHLTPGQLEEMVDQATAPVVSILMPTVDAGPETRQNSIRFKNLLGQAKDKLDAAGVEEEERDALLAHGEKLLANHDFWQHTNRGLAAYIDADGCRTHDVPLDDVPEMAEVGDRPYVKPLLPLLAGDGSFHVLAISQKKVRLFEGSSSGLEEVDLPDLPESLEDALGADTEQQSLQYHTPNAQRGGTSPIYHGQGTGQDDRVADLRRFTQRVDTALMDYFGAPDGPLVLAGVERLVHEFRNNSKHPRLAEGSVAGNHDDKSAQELHGPSWEQAEPALDGPRRRRAEDVEDQRGTDRVVVDDIEAIVREASFNKVEALFYARGAEAWGTFDEETHRASRHEGREAGDIDLYEEAALRALRSAAEVFVVPAEALPGDAERVVALLRF